MVLSYTERSAWRILSSNLSPMSAPSVAVFRQQSKPPSSHTGNYESTVMFVNVIKTTKWMTFWLQAHAYMNYTVTSFWCLKLPSRSVTELYSPVTDPQVKNYTKKRITLKLVRKKLQWWYWWSRLWWVTSQEGRVQATYYFMCACKCVSACVLHRLVFDIMSYLNGIKRLPFFFSNHGRL